MTLSKLRRFNNFMFNYLYVSLAILALILADINKNFNFIIAGTFILVFVIWYNSLTEDKLTVF